MGLLLGAATQPSPRQPFRHRPDVFSALGPAEKGPQVTPHWLCHSLMHPNRVSVSHTLRLGCVLSTVTQILVPALGDHRVRNQVYLEFLKIKGRPFRPSWTQTGSMPTLIRVCARPCSGFLSICARNSSSYTSLRPRGRESVFIVKSEK